MNDMDSKKKILGFTIATAAALAFAMAPVASAVAATHKVPCYGVNSCKGKSECKTANSSCKGTNSCKGQGVMMKSAKQCKKMGGSEKPMS
jgi:uncharacterized membrane protein